jgi:hypothetical protein
MSKNYREVYILAPVKIGIHSGYGADEITKVEPPDWATLAEAKRNARRSGEYETLEGAQRALDEALNHRCDDADF